MTVDTHPRSDDRPGAGPRGGASSPRLALLRGLEQIREHVHRQLDAIEALARERAGGPSPAMPEDFDRQRAELDRARDRLEADRRAMLEQVEHDRRLLGEAWERLEREQIEGSARRRDADRPAPAAQPAPGYALSPASEDRDDVVAKAVFRQFQALKRDVRNRNSR